MNREEIALLAVCHTLQYLAEGTGMAVPKSWIEVGEAAREMCVHREVADKIFAKWEEKGWLDGSFEAPRRCGLSQTGNKAAQAILCWHPDYSDKRGRV